MSRIGRMPIAIPAGVEVTLDGQVITVKKGQTALTHTIHPNMIVAIEDGVINVTRPNDLKENRSLHGLTRTLIANMVRDAQSKGSNGNSENLLYERSIP